MSEKTLPPDQPPPDAQREDAPLGLPLGNAAEFVGIVADNAPAPQQLEEVVTVPAPVPPPLPKPFEMIALRDALAAARSVSVAEIQAWLEQPEAERLMLFDDSRGKCREVAIVSDENAVPAPLWVIGDLHADILALANIVAHADRLTAPGEQPAFLFLGDFVDRGRHDHETLLLLFKLVLERPGRVCIVPGNHDIDLRWDETRERFRVSIEPAEYCEWLNGVITSSRPADREQVELARMFIQFCKERPKAVILPDGTLYAHGGFPHTDMHASLRDPESLAEPNCLSDFMWARLSESPKKRPNRGNRGHEFGWRDFAEFCRVMTDEVKVPVRRLVRGHDHIPQRWKCHPEYTEAPVLTINAMGRWMDGESGSAQVTHPFPVMARHVPNQLPEVVFLPLAAAEVDRAFELDRASPAPAIEEFLAPNVDSAPAERQRRATEPGGGL